MGTPVKSPGLAQYHNMVIAQPDTDMLLVHDEQEAETLLGQKEQGYVALAEPG